MNKLIIANTEKGLTSVLLEEENSHARAVRFSVAGDEESFGFGDIFRVRVRNVTKGLAGAFAELGNGRMAYMNLNRPGVKPGTELTVQISQEAFGTKLPTVSEEISLPGEYLVVTNEPGSIAFSRRADFSGERREQIHACLLPYMTHCGFILRTAAENVSEDDLAKEAKKLTEEFERILVKAAHAPAPIRLQSGQSIYLEWLQGLDKKTLQEVITDDAASYETLRAYFEQAGLPAEKLRFYEDPTLPLKNLYSLEKIREETAGRRVWLKSGAYLVIDRTEAMTVIDVNSGKDEKDAQSPQAAETINREAAKEVARQLQLRNLSGMVMIDFINMKRPGAQEELLSFMRKETEKDPVYTKVLDITQLGIMELTRRRIRRPFL